MYGKDQWRGREVEGRYADMMTYFVRDIGEGIDVKDIQEYPHYYFTIEYKVSASRSFINRSNSRDIRHYQLCSNYRSRWACIRMYSTRHI
jgi:hypothetical protein